MNGKLKHNLSNLKTRVRQTIEDTKRDLEPMVKGLPYTIGNDYLARGLKPGGGGPQPKNKDSTLAHKTFKISGYDTGTLADPGNWTVNDVPDGWEIKPPDNRQDAIKHLRAKGYEFVSVPPKWKAEFIKAGGHAFIINIERNK